jgi:hypothetical protein
MSGVNIKYIHGDTTNFKSHLTHEISDSQRTRSVWSEHVAVFSFFCFYAPANA